MYSNALQFKDPNVPVEVSVPLKRRGTKAGRVPLQELECREAFDVVDDAASWEMADPDTLAALLERDASSCIDTDQWPSLQPQLTPCMRVLLVDWMMEVSTEFMLKRETSHLALRLVDSYTQLSPGIDKAEYQLVGVAALMIACKFEEVFAPKVADLELSTAKAYTKAQIRDMERKLLTVVQWKILGASHYHWMTWAMSQWDAFNGATGGDPGRAFKTATQQCYYLFREAMQILDTLMLDYRQLKLPKNHLVACVLFVVLSRAGGEVDTFTHGFEFFAEQTLAVQLQGVRHVLGYVATFAGLALSYGLPKVCHVLGQETLSSHYEDFLAYQTHNPNSQTFVKQLLQTL